MSTPGQQPGQQPASASASASTSTPAPQYLQNQYQPQPSSYYHPTSSHVHHTHYPPSTSSSTSGEGFTAEMRDRQARGKDPYTEGDVSSEDDDVEDDDDDISMGGYEMGTRLRMDGGRLDKEDFGKAEKRQQAVAFLDNPELLMMYAQGTGETIPAARLHFMKMLCGYDDERHSSTGHYHGSGSPSTPQRGGGGRA